MEEEDKILKKRKVVKTEISIAEVKERLIPVIKNYGKRQFKILMQKNPAAPYFNIKVVSHFLYQKGKGVAIGFLYSLLEYKEAEKKWVVLYEKIPFDEVDKFENNIRTLLQRKNIPFDGESSFWKKITVKTEDEKWSTFYNLLPEFVIHPRLYDISSGKKKDESKEFYSDEDVEDDEKNSEDESMKTKEIVLESIIEKEEPKKEKAVYEELPEIKKEIVGCTPKMIKDLTNLKKNDPKTYRLRVEKINMV